MKIRTRLTLFAVIIAVLIGGVGLYGVSGLRFVNGSMETIYETNLSNIQRLSGVRENYLRIQISLFKLATNQSDVVRNSIITNELTPAMEFIDENLGIFAEQELNEKANNYLGMLVDRQTSLKTKIEDYVSKLNEQKNRDQLLVQYSSIESAMQSVMVICDSLIKENTDAAALEYADAMSSQKSMVVTMLSVVGVSVLVCILFASIIVKSITRPIKNMESGLTAIADGDLTVELQTKDKTEMGVLSRSLSKTTKSLRGLIGQVHNASESIALAGDKLNEMTEKTGDSSSQVANSINEIAKGASELAEHAEEIIRLMSHTSEQTREGGRQLEITTENTVASKDVAIEGQKTIEQAVELIEKLSVDMEKVSASVTKLQDQSASIGNIITTIASISDQTNLLALNANIEAARAGEHGRGFAVVAGEVRVLAEETGNAAKSITDIIKGIQNEVQEVTENIQANVQEVERTVGVMEEGKKSLEKVVEQSTQASMQCEELNVVFGQIENSASQSSSAVESISAIIEESAASSEQVSAAAQEQAATVQEIAAYVMRLNELSENLDREIQLFKI